MSEISNPQYVIMEVSVRNVGSCTLNLAAATAEDIIHDDHKPHLGDGVDVNAGAILSNPETFRNKVSTQ